MMNLQKRKNLFVLETEERQFADSLRNDIHDSLRNLGVLSASSGFTTWSAETLVRGRKMGGGNFGAVFEDDKRYTRSSPRLHIAIAL